MIFKLINQFLKGYLTLTENGSCHHANEGSLVFCYNRSKNISRKECEEECTSSSSCVGYQYELPHKRDQGIRESIFEEKPRPRELVDKRYLSHHYSQCYLIPNSWSCPKDYYQVDTDKRVSIAKTTSDIVPMRCRGDNYCYSCYAKDLVERKYLTNDETEEGKNLHSIAFNKFGNNKN